MMFEQLFGEVFSPSGSGNPQSAAAGDSSAFLTNFADSTSVLSVFHSLQDEFKDMNHASPQYNMQVMESLNMKRAGNDHFAMGRYTNAVEAYRRALELQPGDAKLYTNMSLALVRCGRYEEAVSYAHGATIIDPYFSKGFAMMAIAYAHLGYTDVATFYCGDCLRPFGPEVAYECERAISNSIQGRLDPSMYRQTTNADLQATLNRFHDQYLSVDQLIYLFIHLDFHMSCKDQNQMMQNGGKLRQTGFIRRVFRDIPLTSGVISQSQDLLSISPEEAHLLSACLRITGFASCGSPQACNDLLSCQEFMYFLSSSCRQIVSANFLRTVLADKQRFAFHQLIVDNLLRTLCTATSQGGPYNRFLRPVEPFKSFSWHIKLLGTWFSLFNPIKNADIMCHLVVSVSKICEENQSYLDELMSMQKSDKIALFSLLATVSQIFVECSIHPSVALPIQLDLLLVFWLFLTKDARSVMACVQCPRVWTFLANRLRSVVHNINASTLSGEIWFLLECLCNMASFIKKNPQASEHCFENGPWFQALVEATSDICWRTSKHHVFIRSALMLVSRLASFSPKFGDAFADRVSYTRLVRLASCGEPDVDAPALHCLATLLNNRSNAKILQEIAASPHIKEYLGKTISSITHAITPIGALANDSKTCLYHMIDADVAGEELAKKNREVMLSVLRGPTHNCDAFFRKIQGSDSASGGAQAAAAAQPKRKPRDGGMFSEPLPDDVTPEEAANLTSKLFAALTKGSDELAGLFRTPAA